MMEITQFAPVLIPTLNRYEHFRRSVESLSICTHADKTDLYIALDYPANDLHWEGYNKIKEYLNEISGFKSLNIIQRDKNFGATQNIRDAREQVFQKYDRIILSEDDNEFAPNFLDYINKGLMIFENNKRIYAICAYLFPLNTRENSNKVNYFYTKTFTAWGYGIWRDRYETNRKNIYTPEDIMIFLKDKKNIKELYKMAPNRIWGLLISAYEGIELYGDSIVSLENIRNKTLCIRPTTSLVRNHGHDGSGVNCGYIPNSIYSRLIIDTKPYFNFQIRQEGEIDNIYQKSIKKYLKLSLKHIITLLPLYIITLLKNKKR